MITIKVVELGKAVEEYAFEGSTVSVSEVLEASGRSIELGVKVNGAELTETSPVTDGAVVFIGAKKIRGNADYVEVKFVSLGSASGIKTVAVEPGTSIASAAETAGMSLDGFEIKVNGSTASSNASDSLNSDSRIFLTKLVKGNTDYVEVKFVSLGSASGIKTVAVEPGTSIADAAETAGVSLDGFEIKVNGSTASSNANDSLNSDSRIFLTKLVKGNK